MKSLNKITAENYLRRNSITDRNKIGQILGGFDFKKPVYEQVLEPSEILYQFVRKPSAFNTCPDSGEWFCLSGATMDGLAIIGGGSGRQLKKFAVIRRIIAMEGTASAQTVNWYWGGGGSGGHTQIFIPSHLVLNALILS